MTKDIPCYWRFWTVVLEKTLESPLDCKEIQPVNPKENQSWIFIGRIDAEAETPILWPPHVGELTHLKRPWFWERLRAGGEEDDRGWDGWMASPTRCMWVWVNSGSWWWTGRPGVLQLMGSQSWTRLSDWTELYILALNLTSFMHYRWLIHSFPFKKYIYSEPGFLTWKMWIIPCTSQINDKTSMQVSAPMPGTL